MFPVAVEALREFPPGGYTPPPVKYASSSRSDISYPAGSRSRVNFTSSEASSSLAYY